MELNQLMTMIVGGLFSSVIIYVIKGFFTNLEDRVKKVESDMNHRITLLENKINILSERYGIIFNEILVKFSSWEDRIKKIMEEYEKSMVKNPSGDISCDIKQLDKLMKEEVKSIAKEVDEIENSLKELNHDVRIMESKNGRSQDVINSLKTSLAQITLSLNQLSNKFISINDSHQEKISTLFSICKAINGENQKLNRKIDEVSDMARSKITLK